MEILSWFLLEAFIAMALLLLVVWWTWPRAQNNDAQNDVQNDEQSDEQNNDPKQ